MIVHRNDRIVINDKRYSRVVDYYVDNELPDNGVYARVFDKKGYPITFNGKDLRFDGIELILSSIIDEKQIKLSYQYNVYCNADVMYTMQEQLDRELT